MPVPIGTKTLVLNDDRVPLNTVGWKKGFKKTLSTTRCEHCEGYGVIREGDHVAGCVYCSGEGWLPPAVVVEFYDIFIRDGSGNEWPVPAVIANRNHVVRAFNKVPFSKPNVYRRDNHTCQYCGRKPPTSELTLDHVVPRSMWQGKGVDTPTTWRNIVTACLKCNRLKDNRTPAQAGMELRKEVNGRMVFYKKPKQPTYQEIVLGLNRMEIPPEWEIYVAYILSDRKLT